jgi:CubicO group peptidase (beta-lactamase class C family)
MLIANFCISTQRAAHARLVLCACLAILVGCGDRLESELPPADPRLEPSAGLSTPVRWSIDTFLDASAALELHSGSVAMFAHRGRVVYAKTAGYADIASERPMQLDTRFRIASMTKPITAVAALKLIEEGRLGLDEPVERYLPAARGMRVATSSDRNESGEVPTEPLEAPLTVRHLLTFTAGIGDEEDPSDLGSLWSERNIYNGEGTLAERVDRLLTVPLYEQPGRTWRYGWSADVLARVIEVASGDSIDRYLESRIFTPLSMNATGYTLPERERRGLASMYTQDANGSLVYVPVPRSLPHGWTPGGGGLISTASDYTRFALMLWNGGSYDGVRVITPESVAMMTRPHVTKGVLEKWGIDGVGWGLGLAVVHDGEATPMIDRTGDFWWTGFYGTHFFVSPETDLVGVVLTQNQPSPHSSLPYPVYLAPAMAYFGL